MLAATPVSSHCCLSTTKLASAARSGTWECSSAACSTSPDRRAGGVLWRGWGPAVPALSPGTLLGHMLRTNTISRKGKGTLGPELFQRDAGRALPHLGCTGGPVALGPQVPPSGHEFLKYSIHLYGGRSWTGALGLRGEVRERGQLCTG